MCVVCVCIVCVCVCVCVCVFVCSMDVEIVYYEQEGGVLQKVAELLVQTRNGASLEEICRDGLRKVCEGWSSQSIGFSEVLL